jgi:LacI family transcriptional regulator
MHSVAEAAGVSVSTVSRVVRGHVDVGDAARARVQAVIDELGYRPSPIARALVSGHSMTLGLLVSDIANPFYPQLAKSIERAARKHGYALVICNTEDDSRETRKYVEMLADLRVGGIIQASGGPDDQALLKQVGEGVPVVFTNRRPAVKPSNYVVSDNAGGAVALTEHLLEQGHRHIGFVAGPDFASNAAERLNGFHSVMKSLGSSAQGLVHTGSFSIESGRTAVQDWWDEGRLPTAIIGVNDLVAVGALEQLIVLGLKVPDDVAVAGFDDIELADSQLLALTSVRQHIDQMGVEAVKMLVRLLHSEGHVSGMHKVIRARVIARRSTSHRLTALDQTRPRGGESRGLGVKEAK